MLAAHTIGIPSGTVITDFVSAVCMSGSSWATISECTDDAHIQPRSRSSIIESITSMAPS